MNPSFSVGFASDKLQVRQDPVFSQQRRRRTVHRFWSLDSTIGSNSMSEKKTPNPITVTIAGGLATGLGFAVVGARIWSALEVSQSLTMLVIGVGFVLGAAATFAAIRKKSA